MEAIDHLQLDWGLGSSTSSREGKKDHHRSDEHHFATKEVTQLGPDNEKTRTEVSKKPEGQDGRSEGCILK